MSKYAQNKNQRVSRSNYAEYASLSNIKFCGNILHLADRQLKYAFLLGNSFVNISLVFYSAYLA